MTKCCGRGERRWRASDRGNCSLAGGRQCVSPTNQWHHDAVRVTAPSTDYLHACAGRHSELVERLSGRAGHLGAVERAVAHVRSSRRLTPATLRAIVESPDFTAATKFWTWPSAAEMEAGLGDEELDLWNLPKNERPTLKRLRRVFKTFEAVSVVLRFVVPQHYGILSTPVEHLLGIQPSPESIDRYLNYVRDLRLVRDKRGFERAADVDQALWTLQLGVLAGRLEDCEHLRRGYEQDRLLRSIKAKNLADGLFEGNSRLDLATLLAPHRLDFAASLAALEFERLVRAYATRAKATDELKTIIDAYAPGHLAHEWHRSRTLRNRSVHGQELNHREVEELLTCAVGIKGLIEERNRR